MFRRLIGRSVPTTWEFHTLMGVIAGAVGKSTGGELPKKKRR
jgi:hypothetical protein